MNRVWITSDWHFGHDREFIWAPRGFNSVWEMDKEIIKRYNEVVAPNDDVYCLGDAMLGDYGYGLSCIKQLKGNIHIIRGNHDTLTRMEAYKDCYNIVEVTEGQFLRYKSYHFYLCHYPVLCSNWDYDKPLKARIISLCGHQHTKDYGCDLDKGLIYHCEVDTNNCYPVLIDNIIDDIKEHINER